MEHPQIQQIPSGKMAGFGYLIGDGASGTCALIDPAFKPAHFLDVAGRAGFRVTHVINTHSHPDHTAGNSAVMAASGARLFIHKADAPGLRIFFNRAFARVLGGKGSPPPDVLLSDQDTISIGRIQLHVIHTPGHTPGGICLYTHGHLFTGDTLFVGGVGRTDLSGGSQRQLIRSIREKLYRLPGETRIWPGHDYGSTPTSTIAREMQTNPFTAEPQATTDGDT